MIENDKTKFAETMYGVAEVLGVQVSKPALKLMFNALQEYEINEVQYAAGQVLKTHKFNTFPPVAKFIEFLKAPELSPEDKAIVEADTVIACLRRWGRTKSPNFENPVTQFLMTKRWKYQTWASQVAESELPWFKKEFVSAFQAHNKNNIGNLLDYNPAVLKLINNKKFIGNKKHG
jgi:hypothetical protein